MRRSGRAGVVALVLAGHAVVLGYLAYTRYPPPLAEPPVVTVMLAPPKPPPPKAAPAAPPLAVGRKTRKAISDNLPPADTLPAAAAASAEAGVAPSPFPRLVMPPADHVFKDRSRENCEERWKRLGYPGVPRCEPTLAERPDGGYDPAKDSKFSGFAREAKRKEDMRRYRNGGEYPGMGCAILHKC